MKTDMNNAAHTRVHSSLMRTTVILNHTMHLWNNWYRRQQYRWRRFLFHDATQGVYLHATKHVQGFFFKYSIRNGTRLARFAILKIRDLFSRHRITIIGCTGQLGLKFGGPLVSG